MADFCRDFDEALWDGARNVRILCEGHGLWEDLDGEGRPVKTQGFEEGFEKNYVRVHKTIEMAEKIPGAPMSAADRRPGDKPFYIGFDTCEECHADLVPEDRLRFGHWFRRLLGRVWWDEFECPKCRDGLYMDWPLDRYEEMQRIRTAHIPGPGGTNANDARPLYPDPLGPRVLKP